MGTEDLAAWLHVDDVVAAAEELHLGLSRDDAAVYRTHLLKRLEATAAFLDADLDELAPPAPFAERDRGRPPAPGEDPFGAWLWKCEIRGAETGLLAGRTVSFKDHIAVAGIPLTFGSPVLRDFVPDVDATVVTRILAAGGTIIGKNTLDGFEGGAGITGGVGGSPRPRNPHNSAHVTGGSSSGSAAAVAAGEVDVAFGGCQGGSLRIPAAWCGCVALKPTFGLVSHFGAGFGHDPSLDFIGPIARTHALAGAALEAVAGYDDLDPRAARDIPDRLDVCAGLDEGVDGLRIGLVDEGFADADPAVRDAVLAAADVLAAAGARVERLSISEHLLVDDALDALYCGGARALRGATFLGAFASTCYPESLVVAIDRYWREHSDRLSDAIKLRLLAGELTRRRFDGRAYAKAQNARLHFVRAYDRALTRVDVLAMPTVLRTAPQYVEPADAGLDARLLPHGPREYWFNRNTKPFNYTGHPALAVPCGKSDGLPVSVQLVGRRLDDALLLRVGSAYEQAVDWVGIVEPDGLEFGQTNHSRIST